jgi:uncharacterized protein YjdB
MKNIHLFILTVYIVVNLSIYESLSNTFIGNTNSVKGVITAPEEIIFYSNGSTFSPVIILQAEAEVLWLWEDNTTSNSTTPVKDYGSVQLRNNKLKVTPWSAVRRINIGYNAGDDGTREIEFVADQKVSLVENLNLVAPYLKEWCSSYNQIRSLDFSNFVNLETIECFLSASLENINLLNTPKLKRVCFEDNNLLNLDLTDCIALEDLRGALNEFKTITFSNQTENVWHICVHHNKFSDKYYFSNLGPFPNIADLLIDNTYQEGALIISKTNPTRLVDIRAYGNKYSSLDLRGALKNTKANGTVELQYNELTTVDITGCVQIKELNLSNNRLESEVIDQVLKQVDDYGTSNGTIDLRSNQPPSYIGLVYKTNLENRGWIVNADQNIPVESILVSSASGTSITTDNGTLQLSASILPADATTKTVVWSVQNLTGKAYISASGILTAEKDGTVEAVATAIDGSGIKGELTINISNQIIPVESISVNSVGGSLINSDNGTLQVLATALPGDATNKSVSWSLVNITGKASISASGLITAEKDGTVKAIATATDGSGVKGELTITILNQIIPVESISVSSASGTSITTDNGTLQLSASILPADATTKTVSWSVVNVTGKASISASGLITAEKDGTVKTIATATDGSGVKGELTITISNQIIPVESILVSSASGTSITTDNGTLQLSASILPADATTKTVSWSVVNVTGKASISASGLITAEKDGTVKAIATANDGSGVKGELTITISNQIIPVESILVSSASGTSINTDNGTLQLSASILPADATTKTVSWSVVNVTGKASISETGLLTAEKDGTVKAIATATDGSGVKGELTITISNQIILIEDITIIDNLKNDTINGIGTKLSLDVLVIPQNATNPKVNWIIESITGQAEIDQNGELTTISEGSIKVIVKALDESKFTTQKEYIIALPVLLQQHGYLENMKVFPNPTSGMIQIHFDKLPHDGVALEIRNPHGQILLKKIIVNNISELSLEQYNHSLYFVTIIYKNSVSTHKIINGLFRK